MNFGTGLISVKETYANIPELNETINEDKDENVKSNRLEIQLINLEKELQEFNPQPEPELEVSLGHIVDINKDLFKKIDEKIMIFTNEDMVSYKANHISMIQKFFMTAVSLNHIKIVRVLMLGFYASPFLALPNQKTPLEYAVRQGRETMLKFLLQNEYISKTKKDPILIYEILGRKDQKYNNTVFHQACISDNPEAFRTLCQYRSKIDIYNVFYSLPHHMSRNKEIDKIGQFYLETETNVEFNNSLLFAPESTFTLNRYLVTVNYDFIIIARDKQPQYQSTIIYKQLLNIKERYRRKNYRDEEMSFEFTCLTPVEKKDKDFYRFYFLIKPSMTVYNRLADLRDFKIFNRRKGFNECFEEELAHEFERFKDFHLQPLLIDAINFEFDMEEFKNQNLVEDYFPVHDFDYLRGLQKSWRENWVMLFVEAFTFNVQINLFAPLNSVAFYYGCDYSLYIAFTILYSSYLVVISIPGTAFYIWKLVTGNSADNMLTAIYAIITTVWITVVFECWKRRQNELSFIWNSTDKNNRAIERQKYRGVYKINSITKQIHLKSPVSSISKRIYVN